MSPGQFFPRSRDRGVCALRDCPWVLGWRCLRHLCAALDIGLEFALCAFNGLVELRGKRKLFHQRAERPEPGLQVDRRGPTRAVWTRLFQPPSAAGENGGAKLVHGSGGMIRLRAA